MTRLESLDAAVDPSSGFSNPMLILESGASVLLRTCSPFQSKIPTDTAKYLMMVITDCYLGRLYHITLWKYVDYQSLGNPTFSTVASVGTVAPAGTVASVDWVLKSGVCGPWIEQELPTQLLYHYYNQSTISHKACLWITCIFCITSSSCIERYKFRAQFQILRS